MSPVAALSMSRKEKDTIIAGTRGSALALAQTQFVVDLIQKRNRGLSIETKVIKTSGDENSRKKVRQELTGKDSFTREIDLALINEEIDFAVHSLKDVPVEETGGSREDKLEIAAYPKRESPYDVLVSKKTGEEDMSLKTLPEHARVGTSSLRRGIQLKIFRPDFEIVEIHGNVPTRIRKMRNNNELELDAIVLAEAGLKRLNIENEIDEVISSDVVLPAVGQGCLAVKVRSDDRRIERIVKSIDDEETRLCVRAERAFSKELGGGCNTPIAALAQMKKKSSIRLEGLIVGEIQSGSVKSNMVIRDAIEGKVRGSGRRNKVEESLGRDLARRLKAAASP